MDVGINLLRRLPLKESLLYTEHSRLHSNAGPYLYRPSGAGLLFQAKLQGLFQLPGSVNRILDCAVFDGMPHVIFVLMIHGQDTEGRLVDDAAQAVHTRFDAYLQMQTGVTPSVRPFSAFSLMGSTLLIESSQQSTEFMPKVCS